MRIGKVMGRVTLSMQYETLFGGRFLIVAPQDRFGLAGGARKTSEYLVVLDQLGAGDGDLIVFTESTEAAAQFHPKRVPTDATSTAILDTVVIDHAIA